MINIQCVKLNDTTGNVMHVFGTQIIIAQKGHDLMDCYRLSLQQGMS